MSAAAGQQKFKLGTTLFSFTNEYWHRQYSLEQLIARVAELGLGPGIELVGFSHVRGFPKVTDRFAGEFKDLLARHRLEPSCLSLNADVAIRRGQIMSDAETAAYFEPQIVAAARLGFPVAKTQLVHRHANNGTCKMRIPEPTEVHGYAADRIEFEQTGSASGE